MIRYDPVGLGGPHVLAFVREKGTKLLEILGERARPDAAWQIHSHGAWIPVRADSEAEPFFDRRVVLLVRPDEQPAEAFRGWAEGRLDRLGRFLEACNTGRVVRVVAQDRAVTGIVMGRRGADPNHPQTELPPLERLPAVLAGFVSNVERYLGLLGDPELRFVMALRLYGVPGKGPSAGHVLGLDALPTVVGLTHEAVPIAPVSLVRGVLSELARQIEERAHELDATRSPARPWRWVRASHRLRQHHALVTALDDVVSSIDAAGLPELATVRGWIVAIEVPVFPWGRVAVGALIAVGLVVAAAAAL